jgi:hypothetical protein
MQHPHISRRHFVLRSCAAAIVSAVIPNRGQPEALPQENRPNKPTNPQPNSQPHHILVPLYREGKFIEDVEGDRNKQGTSFVIRIPNDDGLIVPPHRHPEDEHITVIQGTWYLGPGERFDRGVLEEMPHRRLRSCSQGNGAFCMVARRNDYSGTWYRAVQNRFPRAADSFVRAEQPTSFQVQGGATGLVTEGSWCYRGRRCVRETTIGSVSDQKR